MKLPILKSENWQPTIHALHQAVMLYGPIHNAIREHENNYLHMPAFVTSDGLTSGSYANGAQLDVNFGKGAIIYLNSSGKSHEFSLADHTQYTLFEAVLEVMKDDVLSDFYGDHTHEPVIDYLLEKINADESKSIFLKKEDVSGDQSLSHDASIATAFAHALDMVMTGVARFRGRIGGHLTPIVVWPEHFDLSTLWFKKPEMDDYKSHINIGFAPYTPDLFEYPYLYAYLYPLSNDFDLPELPEPAYWSETGFRGVVVKYEDLMATDDAISLIEHLSREIFDALYQSVDD